MLDLMRGIAGRLDALLHNQEFPAPGPRRLAVPALYLRNFPPRDRQPDNPEGVPGVIITRLNTNIRACAADGTVGVLWQLWHPTPDNTTANEDYYRLAEESVDRADDIMTQMIKQGLYLHPWQIQGCEGIFGLDDKGAQPESFSQILYKISAKKTKD